MSNRGLGAEVLPGPGIPRDRTTMVKLVEHLEGAGLAERRPDPANRRAHSVGPTPAGGETLERAKQVVSSVEEERFGGLSAEERRVLHALRDRLNK